MKCDGWVRVRMEGEGGTFEEFWNSAEGTTVQVGRDDGGIVHASMYVPAQRKVVQYTGADGVIRVGDMAEESAAGWERACRERAVTLEGLAAERPGMRMVRRERVGELERYEVSADADPEWGRPTMEQVVWVEAATGRLRRAEGRLGGERVRAEYEYGGAGVRDLHDVGVPRGAAVVDNRADAETRDLLGRLWGRYEEGFGDFVAVESEWQVRPDGGPARVGGVSLHLYARSGDAFLSKSYAVRMGGCGEEREKGDALPAGWPSLELEVALGAVRGREAWGVLVGDGRRVWREGPAGRATEMRGRVGQVIPYLKAERTLAGRRWPTRVGLGAYGPEARVGVVRDVGRAVDGRVYPTAWRTVRPEVAWEHRLRIWAGERLGAEWFVPGPVE